MEDTREFHGRSMNGEADCAYCNCDTVIKIFATVKMLQ